MSLRANVDRLRIDAFLRELGRAVQLPIRLYLVGGTTLVYERLRVATLDIDLTFEVDPAHHGVLMRAVARLKDDLGINAEEVSPADFIPLPSGWRERSPYVGRFGQLEVFHFDPVSAALSKLARGYERDLADVKTMLDAGLIEREQLGAAWNEIESLLPERGWSRAEIAEYRETVNHAVAKVGE
jgi:hypothetical protein